MDYLSKQRDDERPMAGSVNDRDYAALYSIVSARLDELTARRLPLPKNLVRMERQLVTEAAQHGVRRQAA